MKNYDIAIIGGGASAFVAGITAKLTAPNKSLVILERMPRALKKVLATGNGTCNLSNKSITANNYHGDGRAIFDSVYNQFDRAEALDFFRTIGVPTTVDDIGRIYPVSRNAGSVVDALRFKADFSGCDIICDFCVTSLKKQKGRFIIKSNDGEVYADRVIVATGGASQKNLGSDGSGYSFLETFGHKLNEIFPSITPYKTEKDKIKSLRGIKTDCRLSVLSGGKTVHTERGELLFAEYGLSGSVIFKSARQITENLSKSVTLSIDLLPDIDTDKLIDMLKAFRQNIGYLQNGNLLLGMLPKMLALAVIKDAKLSPADDISKLTDGEIEKIAKSAKAFSVKPIAPMGLDKAQVTSGGISTKDFYPDTLESRLCSGLFAAGEVLDIDGDCGGYNLQWAWSSGYVAGKNAAKEN